MARSSPEKISGYDASPELKAAYNRFVTISSVTIFLCLFDFTQVPGVSLEGPKKSDIQIIRLLFVLGSLSLAFNYFCRVMDESFTLTDLNKKVSNLAAELNDSVSKLDSSYSALQNDWPLVQKGYEKITNTFEGMPAQFAKLIEVQDVTAKSLNELRNAPDKYEQKAQLMSYEPNEENFKAQLNGIGIKLDLIEKDINDQIGGFDSLMKSHSDAIQSLRDNPPKIERLNVAIKQLKPTGGLEVWRLVVMERIIPLLLLFMVILAFAAPVCIKSVFLFFIGTMGKV